MTTLNPEYKLIPDALHTALLTSPATKADCASSMIAATPLTLSQTVVERAIDLFIEDLFAELILPTSDYAALLARHQTADPAAALTTIRTSGKIILLRREKEVAEAVIAGATAEWTGLSQAQKNAIPNIKTAADHGIDTLNGIIAQIVDRLQQLESQRDLGV